MIAGSNLAHGDESPLWIVRKVYAVIAMTEGGCSPSTPEAIFISNRTPDIKIKPLLNSESFFADFDRVATLPHFCVWCDKITRPSSQTHIYFIDFPITVITKRVFDKPFNFCCWEISRITNFDVCDRYTTVSKHMNPSRPDTYIGALENPRISYLSACDESQNDSEDADYKSRDSSNFWVVRMNIGSEEPIQGIPETRQHTIAFLVTAGIFLVAIVLAWLFLL
jgi:hypothetical protein